MTADDNAVVVSPLKDRSSLEHIGITDHEASSKEPMRVTDTPSDSPLLRDCEAIDEDQLLRGLPPDAVDFARSKTSECEANAAAEVHHPDGARKEISPETMMVRQNESSPFESLQAEDAELAQDYMRAHSPDRSPVTSPAQYITASEGNKMLR